MHVMAVSIPFCRRSFGLLLGLGVHSFVSILASSANDLPSNSTNAKNLQYLACFPFQKKKNNNTPLPKEKKKEKRSESSTLHQKREKSNPGMLLLTTTREQKKGPPKHPTINPTAF